MKKDTNHCLATKTFYSIIADSKRQTNKKITFLEMSKILETVTPLHSKQGDGRTVRETKKDHCPFSLSCLSENFCQFDNRTRFCIFLLLRSPEIIKKCIVTYATRAAEEIYVLSTAEKLIFFIMNILH